MQQWAENAAKPSQLTFPKSHNPTMKIRLLPLREGNSLLERKFPIGNGPYFGKTHLLP
jgi:hypothetical protein